MIAHRFTNIDITEVTIKNYKQTLSQIYDVDSNILDREVWYNKSDLLLLSMIYLK